MWKFKLIQRFITNNTIRAFSTVESIFATEIVWCNKNIDKVKISSTIDE